MKILFVIPENKDLYGKISQGSPAHPNLGIGYLIASCKKNGYKEIKVFDIGLEKDYRRLKEEVTLFTPAIIGITVFSYCYDLFYEALKKIKLFSPQTAVIVGGPHVSAVGKEIMNEKLIDFAMTGESETGFIQFLEEFKKNKPRFSNVSNLLWRDNGSIVENKKEKPITNLNEIDFPQYEDFKLDKYSYFSSKTVPIITSRGCPYKCNYCSVRLSMGMVFRKRSPQNVVNEIKYWYERKFNNFEINDDCFTLDGQRVHKICDLIISSGIKITYQLYNGIRIDSVDQSLLDKMKKSGCSFISFGIESGNQKVLDTISKGIDLKQARKAIDMTNKSGIKNSVNFIIGHPGETYKTAYQTIEFAKKIPTGFVNFYNLIPYPGTSLFDWIEKNNLWIYHPNYVLRNIGTRDIKPVFETNEFTQEQRIKILKQGFALYERSVLKLRFGTIVGFVFFLLSRVRIFFYLGTKIALGNRTGFKIYSLLTNRNGS